MTQDTQIEIPLSKNKMVVSLLGTICFVGFGFWFLINPSKINKSIFGHPILIFVVGLVSILFFGLVAITIIKKFSNNKVGLIINQEGIIDNSSGVSAGIVLWIDIDEIKTAQVMNQKFLMIIVKNPRLYIDRENNIIKRKGMQMNLSSYGSPISISTNSLKINFDDLQELLKLKLMEYKGGKE